MLASAAIERWELSGGTWRLLSLQKDRATVELLRCDGGEVMELLQVSDSADLAWLVARTVAGA